MQKPLKASRKDWDDVIALKCLKCYVVSHCSNMRTFLIGYEWMSMAPKIDHRMQSKYFIRFVWAYMEKKLPGKVRFIHVSLQSGSTWHFNFHTKDKKSVGHQEGFVRDREWSYHQYFNGFFQVEKITIRALKFYGKKENQVGTLRRRAYGTRGQMGAFNSPFKVERKYENRNDTVFLPICSSSLLFPSIQTLFLNNIVHGWNFQISGLKANYLFSFHK